MATDMTEMTRVNHEKLIRFISRSFEKLGVPLGDAAIAANVLVASDLRGVDTHGVIRFNPHAWYVKWLRDGAMTAKPNIRIVTENASTALLDADNGMGMVAGHRAMAIAIQKAKASGVAIVTVRNSRHYGMSAYYSMLALPHDMIGIAMTNATASGADLRPRGALRHQSDLLCHTGKR
jgi:LDH2 family malate/lactate/ureidoglycolate dehydrogenase